MILILVCKLSINTHTEPDSPLMMISWAILTVLIIALVINFPFIIWKTYLWIRTNGSIDMKLFL